MPVVVVATIIPKPEHRFDVITALKDAISQVHDEDGCELYALHRSDDRLVMIERWASPEALQAHSTGSPGLRKLNEVLKGKLEGPLDVVKLEAVPAGEHTKGQLL